MRSIYAFRSGKQVEGRIFAILIACLLLLGFPFEVAAQRTGSKTFIISGQVTDAQTKQPIPGVAIMLKASNVGVTTDTVKVGTILESMTPMQSLSSLFWVIRM